MCSHVLNWVNLNVVAGQMDNPKWQKRKPLYRILFKLCDQYGKRSLDAMYQMWYSTASPLILDAALVPEKFGQLFGEVVKFSLHRYEIVRQMAQMIVDRAFIR